MAGRFRAVTVAAACGIAGLLGPGPSLVARAQPPEARADDAPGPRQALRERIIALRAEVEVLQLEHDADREDLRESMKALRKLHREGLTPDKVKALEAVFTGLQKARLMASEEEFSKFLRGLVDDAPKEKGRVADYLKGKAPKEIDIGTVASLSAKDEADLEADALRHSIDEKKAAFVRQTQELHRKKFALSEAEDRYKATR